MSFIDDGIAKRKALKERSSSIAEHGNTIFQDLWAKVCAYVSEAKAKDPAAFDLRTNGSPLDRVVLHSVPSTNAIFKKPSRLTISLNDSKWTVSAKSDDVTVDLIFTIDVGADGVAGLYLKTAPMTAEQAATEILRGFLFPDLK